MCDISYLKSKGVTHILNTVEEHVRVDKSKYAQHGIKYYGFHVDDLPHCDIARYFSRTTDFINSAVTGGGLVGWSTDTWGSLGLPPVSWPTRSQNKA